MQHISKRMASFPRVLSRLLCPVRPLEQERVGQDSQNR